MIARPLTERTVNIIVNGAAYSRTVPANRMLADFLREDLSLTGTKRGCETGVCGACTVLLDGEPVKTCLLLAAQVDGHDITTIEGLSLGEELHPLQEAFMENGGLQCGYCTPGFILMSVSILNDNPQPSEDDVRSQLNGNLCRCTGYNGIVKSILAAAEKMNED